VPPDGTAHIRKVTVKNILAMQTLMLQSTNFMHTQSVLMFLVPATAPEDWKFMQNGRMVLSSAQNCFLYILLMSFSIRSVVLHATPTTLHHL
jgi:hypothetical protein